MGSDDSDEENRDRVLAPDDLDITKQPEVEEIDDGRYVVSPDGPAKKPDRELLENPDWLTEDDEETAPQSSSSQPSQPDQPSQSGQEQRRNQSTAPQQSPQADRSTPSQQPQPDKNPTRQSSGRGGQSPPNSQSGGPSQQSSSNVQSGGRNQQSPPNTQSGDPSQQSPPNAQSGGRKQQSPSNPNSGSRNQQPPSDQSGGRNQQSTPDRSTNRGQQAGAADRSGGRSQQPPGDDQSGGRTPQPSSSELAAHDQPPVEPPAVELTNETVSKFLAEELTQGDGDYGFDATLNVEGQVNRGRMTSDDIGETLETLLRWYARQTTDEVEPESVLGIILAGSDLAVEYPVQSVYTVVKRHGLTPDDSIGDLLAAVRKEGSFTVPPSEE
ncbi:DUF7500 family protein [Halohasta litorea]|uniref:Uncharacterized protein n=1 Tax=Halohasta litorea TaxID=869891 RepID=A0ABD6D636_9EURY|nr:hypothetical protein [Halohasta litorea]